MKSRRCSCVAVPRAYFFDRSLSGVYELVGGIEAFRRVSRRFHDRVEKDSLLRPLFPRDMRVLEERLALFLAELTGGPGEYSRARSKNSLVCRHAHLAIGPLEAERWLELMLASLADEGADSQLLGAKLRELAHSLADPFIALYQLALPELRAALQENPGLAVANDHGRNLICAAAVGWDVPRLRLLLEFGADVRAEDGGGHAPLYRAANGMGDELRGREAVELLIAHGADVNQRSGVGGMTPLHMSARRGTTGVAEALLDAGADIDAKDKGAETPLRRAVNCNQEQMVALLVARGADRLSIDKKGRIAVDAARTETMRILLVG